jgi:hypothetical protein
VADLAAAYTLAAAKGSVPAGRDLASLNDWCMARGAASSTSAATIVAYINAFSAAGGASYTVPGARSFTVPYYVTLSLNLFGSGGGGGGVTGAGGYGSVTTGFGAEFANGGGGGDIQPIGTGTGVTGTGGTAGGGNSNSTGTGNNGGIGSWSQFEDQKQGTLYAYGGTGGRGGSSVHNFVQGDLVPGTIYTLQVGAGGLAGTGAGNMGSSANGYDAAIYITWT